MVSPWPTLYKLCLGKKHQIQECAKFTEDHCLWHLVCDSPCACGSVVLLLAQCPSLARWRFHPRRLFQLLGVTNWESAQFVKLVIFNLHHYPQQQHDHEAFRSMHDLAHCDDDCSKDDWQSSSLFTKNKEYKMEVEYTSYGVNYSPAKPTS